jgi:hypothetical protein
MGQSSKAVVYYQITLAVHVDIDAKRINRIIELREEMHPREGDPPAIVTDDGLLECAPNAAAEATRIAETAPWPGSWEFGY